MLANAFIVLKLLTVQRERGIYLDFPIWLTPLSNNEDKFRFIELIHPINKNGKIN